MGVGALGLPGAVHERSTLARPTRDIGWSSPARIFMAG